MEHSWGRGLHFFIVRIRVDLRCMIGVVGAGGDAASRRPCSRRRDLHVSCFLQELRTMVIEVRLVEMLGTYEQILIWGGVVD